MPEIAKKIIIALLISGLCVAAFCIRFENFKKPGPRTTDEAVYYVMARQMDDNIFAYSASAYAVNEYLTTGQKLPEYFYDPLFKHPPAFILMIMLSVKIFGPSALGAGFFPVLWGSLAIALVYLLGSLIGGRAIGFLAAAFMFIDPVGIMSSQKVWMDAPLMFFMLLTVYAYWKGICARQDWWFFLGGLAAGIAVMIKYPGILTFFNVILFVFLTCPDYFYNKKFLISLSFPFLISLPWIFLNCYVYGAGSMIKRITVHGGGLISTPVILTGMMGSTVLFAWLITKKPKLFAERFEHLFSTRFVFFLKVAGFIGAILFVLYYIPKSLNFHEVPAAVWFQSAFSGQPHWFYFQRLLRFCLLYGFSYLAFFEPFCKSDHSHFLLKLNAFILLLFFAMWGNFQCRYILPALPFLMVLSVDFIWRTLGNLARIRMVPLRLLCQAIILIFIVLAVSKTMLINYEVSYTNYMCYF